jgi:hypothetical protein
MKNARLSVTLSALLLTTALSLPGPAHAGSHCGNRVHWVDHRDPADARLAITTEDGKVSLLLTDREVAMQLSDRMVHRVDRQLRRQEDEQDNPLGMAIAAAVLGTVRELIDNSFACRLRDVRDVTYEDGRLRFVGRGGRPVFEDADICDTDVLASFSERDARAFVREFRKLKAES